MPTRFSIFRLERKSLIRGVFLALASLWVSFRISGFPDVHFNLWLLIPLACATAGTWETVRCLQKRWSFYNGGVLLLLYVDLMVMLMILVLLLGPFGHLLL
ncbi:MAG TPA: hypothetical protein VL346_13370 [Acidobacteriaceae bacterium]|nr:hypothetical protein [Acidobacteriaceae bacterium]